MIIPDFDEATHTYMVGGVKKPPVTTVLKSAGLIDAAWYTEEARVFGKAVHAAIGYFNEGDLDEASLSDSMRPYLDGWRKFLDDAAFKPDLIEQPMASPHGFAGTADAIESGRVLVDIKTGSPEPWHSIQTAMYASMLDYPYVNRLVVYLNDRGAYSVKEHPKAEYIFDLNVGLNALAICNWRMRNGR